ncbi:NACHT, LRR and PYD domains-containing protein 2 [Tamandua tetradactyla]|uniref:NACHT, LRR and PYD domains-containing protein 2 n=1 Tax=Tamandua tetradactyla TaxID=48850 RepID=UPI004053FDE2
MASSMQLDFNLQLLLEQLDQDELGKFKSLLKALPLPSELQHIPQKVEVADGKQLAEILIDNCPGYWVELVTIQAFDKMGRWDLAERAKDELRSKEDKYRSILKKKFWRIWNFWPGASENFPVVTQRYAQLIPFCNPKMLAGPFPHTVVLQGAAGVGKTTLAKKLMLDWTEDTLTQTFKYTFYLCCKELNQVGTCTFAELISKDWPELQDAIPEVLAQPQKVLFIIDGFDELRVPSGALIRDICGDWKKEKPVPVLLGSLLKRKMLPEATLLITTRPWALRELRLLVEQPLIVEVDGFLELDRKEYFLKHFKDEGQALRAFDLMRSNVVLFSMGSAPLVCWIVCSCLGLQMERGEDPTLTCQTTTSLFLRFLCSQFTPAPVPCPRRYLQAPLKALCLLAAQGVWTQTLVFDEEDLRRLGVEEEDVCLFLDKNIFQRDKDCEGCYCFIHLSVQQFLAAMFYILGSKEEEDGGSCQWDIGGVEKLLSKEERLKNPSLIQVGYFLFGLLNKKRVKELETTFGCQMSVEAKRKVLKCKIKSNKDKPLSSATSIKELFYCLYESQEEEFVEDAVGHFKEICLYLKDKTDVLHSSFCLKHCQNLQKLLLHVEKGVFLENDATSESDSEVKRSQSDDQHILPFWMDLCSIFGTNSNLVFLDITESFLSNSSVRILCEKINSANCSLQKVVLKNIFPADAFRNFCLAFSGQETLTHLTIQGSTQDDMLLSLCEVLKHPNCNLQCLRLESCSATTQQWAHLSLTLQINESLTCLNLTSNEILDEGVKFLCTTLTDPKCSLQRLLLENCHLTEACCKDLSSALIVNQRLMYLSLAKNKLGDSGVRLLCEGLSYPDCKLQTLVLSCCSVTEVGCNHLSKLLQQKSSLTHLDLGLNPIGVTGLMYLCEALKEPVCDLKYLMLWACALTPSGCMELSSALSTNKSLVALDLSQNTLACGGIKVLGETLRLQTCSLQTLRLNIDESDTETQKLLKEIRESNPQLTIESGSPDPRKYRRSSLDFLF